MHAAIDALSSDSAEEQQGAAIIAAGGGQAVAAAAAAAEAGVEAAQIMADGLRGFGVEAAVILADGLRDSVRILMGREPRQAGRCDAAEVQASDAAEVNKADAAEVQQAEQGLRRRPAVPEPTDAAPKLCRGAGNTLAGAIKDAVKDVANTVMLCSVCVAACVMYQVWWHAT